MFRSVHRRLWIKFIALMVITITTIIVIVITKTITMMMMMMMMMIRLLFGIGWHLLCWSHGDLEPGHLPGQQVFSSVLSVRGKLGSGQLGPRVWMSGVQLSALKKHTVGPTKIVPPGPIIHIFWTDSWAPNYRALGENIRPGQCQP